MADNLKLNVAYLYPQLLNLSGDCGNITAIKKYCEWRNIDVEIQEIESVNNIDISKFDLFYMGSGEDVQQIEVAKEIVNQKEIFQQLAQNNAVFLGISSGFQLFGEYFETANKEKVYGLNILDVYTINGSKRFSGNVTATINFLTPNTFVGFENHISLTYLKDDTKPLATVRIGNGNNGEDKTEGARKNNVFGTNLHGAILPQNPHFTDYLIKLALKRKYYENIILPKTDISSELNTHNALIDKEY